MKSKSQTSKTSKKMTTETSKKQSTSIDEFLLNLVSDVDGVTSDILNDIRNKLSENKSVINKLCLSVGTKKVKKVKDPNAPKRGKSSYILFCQDAREKIVKNNPVFTTTDVMKELGSKWRGLSEKEKGKYVKLSVKDKQRYEKELKTYKEKNPDVNVEKPKSTRKKSGYLVFCQETRATVKSEHSDWSSQNVTKELGKRWKSLSPEEQSEYNNKV